MNDDGFPSGSKPKKIGGLSWVWIVSLALLIGVFAFASVPGVTAQGRDAESQTENAQRSRRYMAVIQQVFEIIQRSHVDEVDPEALFEGAMTGMFDSLDDPYSAFLPVSEMRGMNDTTQGTFGGVGLYISQQTGKEHPYVEVASPIEETPGSRAGISAGDLIISIDGEPTDRMNMEEVLSKLRGRPGTDVTLVIRRGERLEFPKTLRREIIEVPTTRHAMIGNDIGYVRLLSFTPRTAARTEEAIAYFKENGYRAMILDLRNNYGGLLNSAIDISSFFLDDGLVVSTRSRIASENRVFNTTRPRLVDPDIPVIVLTNRGSASASEIVAGALKDRHRALLVGETTYGKGSVQQVFPLGEAGFRLTTARYYTPSDISIDGVGIIPDRHVPTPDFSDANVQELNRLLNDQTVAEFVSGNPGANQTQVDAFARRTATEYGLELALIRRLIRNEQHRTTTTPVFDLEFDNQLQDAVNILRNGEFQGLMRAAKTIRALQEELWDSGEEDAAA
ncbi:MAG: S41 family peptidase [Treponema sp.]|nr:S41 family peptidase [Treponema sp.]